jgi:hypothetical protein
MVSYVINALLDLGNADTAVHVNGFKAVGKVNRNYYAYNLLVKNLNQTISKFNAAVCNRCYGNQDPSVAKKTEKWHHDGKLHSLISSEIDISEMIKPYFDDVNHGLFHGLMTALVTQLIDPKPRIEEILASCMLHDFLKANGFPHEDHDKLLFHYFPRLLGETYTHSNPPNAESLLIIGDRLELRRFPDYQSWIDARYDATCQKLNDKQVWQLDFFYQNIRPALKYLYQNRNKIFIRHGLEQPEKRAWQINTSYPPNDSYFELAGGYAIEIDRPPFDGAKKGNRQRGYCSNHDDESPWNQIKGFISFDDFLRFGGKIVDSNKRDHLYATSDISIENWIFLHRDLPRRRESEFESLSNLDEVFIIHQETVSLFFTLIKLMTTKLAVLNQRIAEDEIT